ncbi:MAG: hypothetical protein Alis3KO_39060 [Aliiglaciecola sp.]
MIIYYRIIVIVCALLCSLKLFAQAQPNNESATKIRATFMFHIVNYSRWQSEFAELTFCVLEERQSQKYFSMLTSNEFKGASEKPISILNVDRIEDTLEKQCNYLFVDSVNESDDVFRQLNELERSVVSIGETSRFVDRGGMMSLVEEFKKIKIYINRDKYKSAPTKFSARLLKYAKFTG